MNIVFVTGLYYPRYSAVGKCVKNLAAELSRQHNVAVLSIRQQDSPEEGALGDGGETLLYANDTIDGVKACVQARVEKGEKVRLWRGIDRLLSLGRYARKTVSQYACSTSRVKSYFQSLEGMTPEPDLLIPCAGMFENVLPCVRFKQLHPRTTLAPILFDQFADSTSLYRTDWEARMHRDRNLQMEDRVLETSDVVFTVTWEDHIRREHNKWMGKVQHIEHPMLVPPENDSSAIGTEEYYDAISSGALFAGTLQPSVRDSSYAIKLFQKLHEIDCDAPVLDLYALGTGAELARRAAQEAPGAVAVHNPVSNSEMVKILRRAEVLVSIGNMNTLQKPSKHVEYMATGKPIVHFASLEDDPAVDDLRRYPLAVVLYEKDDFEENVDKLQHFLKNCKGKELSYEEAAKSFPEGTPSYVANVLVNAAINKTGEG